MTVRELNREQLKQLKIDYLSEMYENDGESGSLSYGEIACIDLIVSDDEIYRRYIYTVFVEDDFA